MVVLKWVWIRMWREFVFVWSLEWFCVGLLGFGWGENCMEYEGIIV